MSEKMGIKGTKDKKMKEEKQRVMIGRWKKIKHMRQRRWMKMEKKRKSEENSIPKKGKRPKRKGKWKLVKD